MLKLDFPVFKDLLTNTMKKKNNSSFTDNSNGCFYR